jgi:hypothetical protein
VAVSAVLLATACEKSDAPMQPTPSPKINTPIWEQPIPEGMTLLPEDAPVKLRIKWERVNRGSQARIEFHITEESGYMVDGVELIFWYRSKNDAGEWVEDGRPVNFFVPDRLMPGETVVTSTPLLHAEFVHLNTDLAATTTENWLAEIVGYRRAMEKVQ